MKIIFKNKNQYIFRFDRGEELIACLKKICQKEKIVAGFFEGIGAALSGEIAFYNFKKKRYFSKKIKIPVEILSILGNISIFEGEIIIHSHGVFSDKSMKLFGGHINYLVIAATCEVFLKKFQGRIKRKFSKEIGLKLMEGL